MNIIEEVAKGASNQFGREFGRAGANIILNGANSYTVKQSVDYDSRIKPSDSEIVKTIKEINKIKFVTTDKGNVSRLIEITGLIIPFTDFKENETLNQTAEFQELLKRYNTKYSHGINLVSDQYEDKSKVYLDELRTELINKVNILQKKVEEFIEQKLTEANSIKKEKSKLLLYSFPILGSFGIHKFYLGKTGMGILYIILIFISPLISLIEFLQYLFMSEKKFNLKYNPMLVYYSQFSFKKEVNE